jgi:hypothetical protein
MHAFICPVMHAMWCAMVLHACHAFDGKAGQMVWKHFTVGCLHHGVVWVLTSFYSLIVTYVLCVQASGPSHLARGTAPAIPEELLVPHVAQHANKKQSSWCSIV